MAPPVASQEPPAVGDQEEPSQEPPKGLFPGIQVDLRGKRITVEGAIAIPRGLIELVACTRYGKTHESICALEVDPQHFKAAILLLGLKESPQVKRLGEAKPLTGDKVVITIEWEEGEETRSYRAEELIWDRSTKSPMEKVGWVFTGSRFLKVPYYTPDKEEPEEREVFMASEKGSLVTTYHDPDSILDNPLAKGGDDTIYHANDKLLPPRGTRIRFILEPAEKRPEGAEETEEVEGPQGEEPGEE